MQVSHVEKNMVEVEQSSTVPNSQSIRKEYLNHTLGKSKHEIMGDEFCCGRL